MDLGGSRQTLVDLGEYWWSTGVRYSKQAPSVGHNRSQITPGLVFKRDNLVSGKGFLYIGGSFCALFSSLSSGLA